MAAESQPLRSGVVIVAADGRHAEVIFTGDFSVGSLRDLEERLDDPQLKAAGHWALDLRGVTGLDLACAYALLRAVSRHSGTATVDGARDAVLDILRQVGLDRAAVIKE